MKSFKSINELKDEFFTKESTKSKFIEKSELGTSLSNASLERIRKGLVKR